MSGRSFVSRARQSFMRSHGDRGADVKTLRGKTGADFEGEARVTRGNRSAFCSCFGEKGGEPVSSKYSMHHVGAMCCFESVEIFCTNRCVTDANSCFTSFVVFLSNAALSYCVMPYVFMDCGSRTSSVTYWSREPISLYSRKKHRQRPSMPWISLTRKSSFARKLVILRLSPLRPALAMWSIRSSLTYERMNTWPRILLWRWRRRLLLVKPMRSKRWVECFVVSFVAFQLWLLSRQEFIFNPCLFLTLYQCFCISSLARGVVETWTQVRFQSEQIDHVRRYGCSTKEKESARCTPYHGGSHDKRPHYAWFRILD